MQHQTTQITYIYLPLQLLVNQMENIHIQWTITARIIFHGWMQTHTAKRENWTNKKNREELWIEFSIDPLVGKSNFRL